MNAALTALALGATAVVARRAYRFDQAERAAREIVDAARTQEQLS